MKIPSPSPTSLPPGERKKFKKVITGVADHGSHFTVHGIFRIDLHATCVAPIEDGNVFPLTYTSPTRGEEKSNKASPTRGEGKFPTHQ